MELTVSTALMIGLFGSMHCLGMCGGIVGALNAGLPQPRRSRLSRLAYHLTYNAGRILSYGFAGLLAGLVGSQATKIPLGTVVPLGRLIAGLIMIALGLYLAGWWHALTAIEKAGLHLWKRIEPLGRRFVPATTPLRAFGLGLVWGWLPCGLVYSALTLALVSASPRQGAVIMLGFGLGTLPMLVAMGGAAEHLLRLVRHPAVRQVVGAVIVLFGAYTCVTAFGAHGDEHAYGDGGGMGHEMSKPQTHSQ